MAELPAIKSGIAPEQFFGELRRIVWTGLTDGDTGEHCLMSEFADRSVQVIGNLDGGTLSFEGTLEETPATWAALTNTLGDPLTFTAAGLRQISELTFAGRPRLSGAGASADVTVILVCRRGRY